MATTKTQRRAAKKKEAKRREEQRTVAVPYFTRQLLMDASRLGVEWDFNRQISEEISEVPSGHKFPVTFFMEHNHRRMKRCEPHVRCVIMLEPGHSVICDMTCEFFHALPMVRVPARLVEHFKPVGMPTRAA
jgi:hypothetical protein